MKRASSLALSPDNRAWLEDIEVTIAAAVSIDEVMVTLPDGSPRCVAVAELSAAPKSVPAEIQRSPDLATISEADWQLVTQRSAVVRRLSELPSKNAEEVRKAAKSLNISAALMYRLLARWRNSGGMATTLLPKRSGPMSGTVSRISPALDAIIESAIKDKWLTRQQETMEAVIREVNIRCRHAKLQPPSPTTVRARIAAHGAHAALKARRGPKAARATYEPLTGHFPATCWPLQVMQIDHTLVDATVVDQVHRRPIGRPWLTIAIDIHTRMVAGFLLSLEPPQATSVALCLAHAVLPKEEWLSRWKIEARWPVWGKPDTIHVDNGKEFHSEALSRGCQQHGITLDFRPVARPQYGGHIERLIGTMMGEVHLLPGTTFSNIKEKGDYDSERRACMTFDEMQEWMTRGLDVYHNRLHSGVGMPPLAAWKNGILGTVEAPGRGLPPRIADPERFLIDFLPLERRAVSRNGIQLYHIDYYSDVLRPLIKDGHRYVVRYDPRDLSRVWLLSKDNEYYALPYRARHRPPVSLWEHKMIVRMLQEQGRREVDADAIFNQLEKMRDVVTEAAARTKKARRQAERIRQGRRSTARPSPTALETPSDSQEPLPPARPFEVEFW
jgi:putative transposase